jgi:SAM-dependent methyltransferase
VSKGLPVNERGGSGIRISGRRAGQRFDAEHRVTTEALLFLGDLDPEAIGPSLAHATHYEPTPVGEVAALLAHVPFDLARTTFVDLGSGMGRALMEAARFPFRQVVGVEISPALHAVALDNFARLDRADLACRDVRLLRDDAALYRFPRGPIVVYLYNPFSRAILARILARLKENGGRAVAIVYHTPVERATIEADPAFELVAEAGNGSIYLLARAKPHRKSAFHRPE